MRDTMREFREYVESCVKDDLSSLDDADLQTAFRDEDFDAHEIADGCVPVYNQEIVNVCLDGGLLFNEPEIEGATTPIQMMQYVLYDEACRICYEAFEEFKKDEDDQRERFRNFLDGYGRPGDFEDCETAYLLWTDNPRSGMECDESDLYEDVFEDWKESQS